MRAGKVFAEPEGGEGFSSRCRTGGAGEGFFMEPEGGKVFMWHALYSTYMWESFLEMVIRIARCKNQGMQPCANACMNACVA